MFVLFAFLGKFSLDIANLLNPTCFSISVEVPSPSGRVSVFLFLESGEGWERNVNVWLSLQHPPPGTWPATQACAPTGNQTSDPLGSQTGTQFTELHQPGQEGFLDRLSLLLSLPGNSSLTLLQHLLQSLSDFMAVIIIIYFLNSTLFNDELFENKYCVFKH